VTDHCTLLQEYSKLYHYLQEFEMDFKRKIAMENKRIELLLPLLKQLNKTSYEVLHKQVTHFLIFSIDCQHFDHIFLVVLFWFSCDVHLDIL